MAQSASSAAATSSSAGRPSGVARTSTAFCPIPDASVKVDFTPISHPPAATAPSSPSALQLGHFRGRHLLSVGDLTRQEVERLLTIAEFMCSVVAGPGSVKLAKGCILTTLFYEPSTRTSTSFQAAMLRLGGQVISVSDVANSSVAKGETLEDTVRCLQCYTNIIAMRHPEVRTLMSNTGAALRASRVLDIPLINAGDGIGEHPTQALLDLCTLHGELGGRIDGLVVTMVGDLKHGRTVHSLSKLLALFDGCMLRFVSPEQLTMPDSVLDLLKSKGTRFTQHNSLEGTLHDTDVLYVTRVQKERFASASEYDAVKDSFLITPELLSRLGASETLRILHPLPRVNELSHELDKDPRAAYFKQMKYGLYMRMAIIAALLGKA